MLFLEKADGTPKSNQLPETFVRGDSDTQSTGSSIKDQKTLVGENIDGFQVLSLIGEGGFSKVYKVSPELLPKQFFALKFVPNKAHAPLLEAEAEILSILKHPNIPTPIRLGSYAGGSYLVMDYIPNTLHNLLNESKNRLPYRRSLTIVKNLLKILDYAHLSGIVHKDLKPRNIGIDDKDNVYLFDFNVAKTLQSNNVSHIQVENSGLQSDIIQIANVQKSLLGGTEGYQSPEQRRLEVNGKVYPVTTKSDIYTIGIVIYQLLMGSLPFGSYTKPSKKPGEAGLYPEWLDDLIDKALQPIPDYRPDVAGMLRLIDQGLDGKFNVPPTPPQPSKLGKLIKSLIILPFRIALSPLYCAWFLLSGKLPDFFMRLHPYLGLPAMLLTMAIWVSPVWAPITYYKITRDQELAVALKENPAKGSFIVVRNKSLSIVSAQKAILGNSSANEIMTHNEVDDLTYVGKGQIAYIYKRALWVLNTKDGNNKQILATKGTLDDRFISKIESQGGHIYFKLSSGRWFIIDTDGKNLAELSMLPAFQAKNVSPDGNFLISGKSIIWNQDRWGSYNLDLVGNKIIWAAEDLTQ